MRLLFTTLLLLGSMLPLWSQSNFQCSTDDSIIPASVLEKLKDLPLRMQQQNARKAADMEMKVCRIAVEIGLSTYLGFDKDTTEIYRTVFESIHASSQVLEREINTRLVVTSIRIQQDEQKDPFREAKTESDIFHVLMNSLAPKDDNFDKRLYLYSHSNFNMGLAIIGGPAGVASLNRISTIIHELGHTFGAVHTHNCNWPGGAIDHCASIEGDCYKGSLSNSVGTIMSYCEKQELSFHPIVRAFLRDYAEERLQSITSTPEPVRVGSEIIPKLGQYFVWEPSIKAQYYRVSYALNADFSDETIVETPIAAFNTNRLHHATYYFRVRAVNEWGSAPWSETFLVRPHAGFEAPPQLLSPANYQILASFQPTLLQFSSVNGAIGYQVQTANLYDADWHFRSQEYVTSTQLRVDVEYTAYKWRVRAVYPSGNLGVWSEVRYYSGNAQLNIGLQLPFHGQAKEVPTTFPFHYSPLTWSGYTKVDLQVTVATDANFENVLVSKSYQWVPLQVSDVIENLPPSTQLYFRLTEISANFPDSKPRKVVDFIQPFTTTSTGLPQGFTFLSSYNQEVFGSVGTRHLAIGKNYVWFDAGFHGLHRIDPIRLTSSQLELHNSDFQIGNTFSVPSIQSSQDQTIGFLNKNWNGLSKLIRLKDEELKSLDKVNVFSHQKWIEGFDVVKEIYWTPNELIKITPSGNEPIIDFSDHENITSVKVHGTNAWVVLQDYLQNGMCSLLQIDLQSNTVVNRISSRNTPLLDPLIYQAEVTKEGFVWIRQQYGYRESTNSLAFYDGENWHRFNRDALADEGTISQLCVSPSGNVYVALSGDYTQLYRYIALTNEWEAVGDRIPLVSYDDVLSIDSYENAWFVGKYALANFKLLACEPKAIVSNSKDVLSAGEAVVLKAENCSKGQLFSWSNQEESKSDQFVAVGETLTLQLFSTTTFRVKCEGKNCVDEDSTFTIQVTPQVPIEIEDEDIKEGEVSVKIYPNPASDYLLIDIKNASKVPYVFHLVDMTGVTVRTISTQQAHLVNLNSLPPAHYIIWAIIEGKKKVWEVVKQ